jgi:hypothetical protein
MVVENISRKFANVIFCYPPKNCIFFIPRFLGFPITYNRVTISIFVFEELPGGMKQQRRLNAPMVPIVKP